MPKSLILSGHGRVEYSDLFGRKIRCGALADLKVADQDRLIEWIRAGKTDEAVDLLEVLCLLYLDMNKILLEWSLSCAQTLRQKLGADAETEIGGKIYLIWKDIIDSESESQVQIEAGKKLLTLLMPNITRNRSDCQPLSEKLNESVLQTWNETLHHVKNKKIDLAIETFESFVLQARRLHDFLCQYLWVYPSELSKSHGQKFSEDFMLESFQSCTMYESLFRIMVKLSPEGMVAFLAEHLRGHFSGPGHRGKVEIIEEDDRYRLIFDACGSGGAMRRKAIEKPLCGLDTYAEASPSTWGMAGNVSVFCAHCAQNEIFMVKRFGFPAWIVNYDADPMKPCGWTVYKDYANVPEKYYERIGFKKDPSKMVKLPTD